LKLPVEVINQAAGLFLRKQKNWKDSLVLIHKGKTAKIYRPDVNLFICLKIERMSESDLSDCLAFIRFAKRQDEPIQRPKLISLINRKMKSLSGTRPKRLERLLQALG
jgi:hypothetical protein